MPTLFADDELSVWRVPRDPVPATRPTVQEQAEQNASKTADGLKLCGFSTLLATVRDLGSAMARTVADCGHRGVSDLLCRYHFLAAVNHCLLDEYCAKLRGQLSSSELRTRLRDLRARPGRRVSVFGPASRACCCCLGN